MGKVVFLFAGFGVRCLAVELADLWVRSDLSGEMEAYREFSLTNIPWGSGAFCGSTAWAQVSYLRRFGPDPWLEQGNKPHIEKKRKKQIEKYIYIEQTKKNGKTKPHDKW